MGALRRDIERFAFVICRELRDVRRRSTLGFAEHITPSNARLYHACESKYITRDAVALYHDGNAVYITPP